MKTLILLFGCVVLSTNYQTLSGGLVLDLFDNVKKGVDKVRDDARTVLHIKKEDNKGDGNAETKGNTDRTTTTSTTTSTTTETGITARAETTTAETTVTAKNTTTDATVTTETTTIALTDLTDDKEGKENLDGSACAKGYFPTDDGRCKLPFNTFE